MVAPVETSETFDGGTIILPQSVREGVSQYQCTVLAIGAPEICEDKRCQRPHDIEVDGSLAGERQHPIPPELVVGAWVLVRQRCYIDAGDPLGKQYFVHINNVEAVFVQSTEAAAEVT